MIRKRLFLLKKNSIQTDENNHFAKRKKCETYSRKTNKKPPKITTRNMN